MNEAGEPFGTLVIATGHHFVRSGGRVVTAGPYHQGFFAPGLRVFARVEVIARVRDDEPPPDARPVDGVGVTVRALPDFRGPAAALRHLPAVARVLDAAARQPDAAFLLRAPGLVPTALWMLLMARRRPWGVYVVHDPRLDMHPGSYGAWSGRLFGTPLARVLRAQCGGAQSTAYVTGEHLQRAYPPGPGPTFAYSGAVLDDDDFRAGEAAIARIPVQPDALAPPRLVFVGELGRPAKGLGVLLDALRRLHDGGMPASLTVVGDGALLDRYRARAAALGIGAAVRFTGWIGERSRLRDELATSHLFVLPTRREGLPRALLEAMAAGLPAVCTPVAGIPELLPPEDMVPVDDSDALARRVAALARSREARLAAARRNHHRARAFHHDIVARAQHAHLRALRAGMETRVRIAA